MTERIWPFLRGAGIVLGLALIFTLLGVYDRGGQSFLERFTVWLLLILVGTGSSLFLAPMVFDREPCASWPSWVQVPVAAAAIALPVTIALLLLDASDGRIMPVRFWAIQYGYVYVVSFVITIGGYLLSRHEEAKAVLDQAPLAVTDPVAQLMERLPVRFRGADLWGLSSEDHYLRFHTSRGEELILMRLADAVDILANARGLQVHRSWWVARDGVKDVARDNGKTVLILKSGARVPVSRTFQKSARQAGLF